MARYKVECNYNASIIANVEANDEGEALDKARDYAEDADIRQFTIGGERESRILRTEEVVWLSFCDIVCLREILDYYLGFPYFFFIYEEILLIKVKEFGYLQES